MTGFNVGSIIAYIKADISDFQKNINAVKGGVDDAKKRVDGMGDSIKNFATGASVISGVVGAGLGIFLKSASDSASEFNKNMITLDIIAERFGESGAKAQKSAKALGDELRIGTGPAANALQNLLKSGLNIDQASDLIKRFTNEAMTGKSSSIDLGTAVENLSFAFATGNSALGNMSGISENWSDITKKGADVLKGWNGEANASLGITEDLANQIKKYEDTLKKQGKTLDASNDEQAKYIGLLQLTNLTMGSSERFQGTYTDNVALMSLKMNDLKVAVGTTLQTALNPLVMWFNSSGVLDGIANFARSLTVLMSVFASLAKGDIADARGALFDFIQFFESNDDKAEKFAQSLYWVLDVFSSIGKWISDNMEIIQTFFTGLAIAFGSILVIAPILLMALNPFIATFFAIEIAVGALFLAWQTNFLGIQNIVKIVVNAVVWIFQNILVPAFNAVVDWLGNSFIPAWIKFFNDVLKPNIEAWTAWFKENWENIKLMLQGIWEVISGIIQIAWSVISGLLTLGLQLLTADWAGAWETIKRTTANVWEGVKRIFSGIIDYVKGWGGILINTLTQPFEDAWNRIRDTMNKIKDALDFTKRHSPSVVDIMETGVAKVNKALGNLAWGIDGYTASPFGDFNLAPVQTPNGTGGYSIIVNLDGALIADDYSAQRVSEMIGDGIISKLQKSVRF